MTRTHDAWLVDLDGTLYRAAPVKLAMAAEVAEGAGAEPRGRTPGDGQGVGVVEAERRQQFALEQRKAEEAVGGRKQESVRHHLPQRPPRAGESLPRHERSTAEQHQRHADEIAD